MPGSSAEVAVHRLVGHGGRGPLGPAMRLSVILIRPLVRVLFRFRFRGTGHIPPVGPVILVVNHVSLLDPFLVARFSWDAGRIPRFLVKRGLFDVLGIGSILRGAHQIPVDRGVASAPEALHAAEEALARGELVVVYPEGTVTADPTWWPMRAKTGLARLALAVDAPVIPVAVWGPQRAWNYHTGRVRLLPRATAEVRAGAAVDLTAYRGRPVDADLLHAMTDATFTAVRDELALIRGEPAPTEFFEPDTRTVP